MEIRIENLLTERETQELKEILDQHFNLYFEIELTLDYTYFRAL